MTIEMMKYRPLVLTVEKGWLVGEDTPIYSLAKTRLQELAADAREKDYTVLKQITKLITVKTYNC